MSDSIYIGCNKCKEQKAITAFCVDKVHGKLRNPGRHNRVGTCKSCIAVNSRKWRKANPNYLPSYGETWRSANPEKLLLQCAAQRSRKNGLEFNITIENIVIPERCPVLNIALFLSEEGRSDNSPSLDRIDNTKGYIKGNVLVVSWRANRLKHDATADELIQIGNFYKNLIVA
jgi:hypothetical protein